MSISQINKLFQNKGCNIAMSAVLGVAVISMLGWGSRGCGGQTEQNAALEEKATTVVSIGDYKVTRTALDQMVPGEGIPGSDRYAQQAQKIEEMIAQGLARKLAKSKGIEFSADELRRKQIDAATDQYRQQLMQIGKLSFTATEQDFENAYKAITGKPFSEERKKIEQNVDEALKTPSGKAGMEGEIAFASLVDHEKSKYAPTDADIKKQFDKFQFKVIQLRQLPGAKQTAKEKGESILREIKGGLSFEAAMDKYPSTPPAKGKKPSEEKPIDVSLDQLESIDAYKSLISLKPGEVSQPIDFPGGASAIFKLVGRKVDVPKDFDKQKPALMDAKSKSLAAKAISEERKKLDTPENVQWENKGYELLHEYMKLNEPGATSEADKPKKLRDLVDRALALDTDPQAGDPAIAAARLVLMELTPSLSATEANQLKAKVLSAYVDRFPEVDAKMELVDVNLALADKDQTGASMRQAADILSAHTDQEGKRNWDRLHKAIQSAEAKKLLSAEDKTTLDKAYQDWLKVFTEQEKEAKQIEESRKKVEEELNKAGKAPVPIPPTGKPDAKTPGPKKPAGKP